MNQASPRDVALLALELGFSPVPPMEDGTKAPLADQPKDGGGWTWKGYQTTPATPEHVEGWYAKGRTGVGLATGYGGLEVLEFDDRKTYDSFVSCAVEAGLGDLVESLRSGYEESTPGGGIHWPYRTPKPLGNTELAKRPDPTTKHGRNPLIETRGVGGFIVIAPSHGKVHPSGGAYRLERGGLESLATLSTAERDELWTFARMFDEMPCKDEPKPKQPPTPRPVDGSTSPGDDFNARSTWDEILVGWTRLFTRGSTTYWRRPGKDRGTSATTGHTAADTLKVFTTSTPFKTEGTYTKLGAWAALNHGDVFKEAVKALAERGFGTWVDDRGEIHQNPRPNGRRGRPRTADATHQAADVEVNEAADDPHRLARLFLASHQAAGSLTLRFYRGEWLSWSAGAYRPVSDHELQGALASCIKGEFDRLNALEVRAWEASGGVNPGGRPANKPETRKVTRPLASNVMLALESLAILSGKTDPPFWLDGPGPFDPRDVLPMRNMLVNLPGVETGDLVDPRKFVIPATPRFFSRFALDFDFNHDADPPSAWLDFLHSVWPDDPQSVAALQEWFGYTITPDTRQQKIALMIGPPRSGRGTIASVLTNLVGPENVASPTLGAFATNFGLEDLIGKQLAIVGDGRLSGRNDSGAIVEALLGISGEDSKSIDRKYRAPWTGTLPTRIMIVSNELPRLPDQAGALASRFIVWRFTRSFLGREDLGLNAKLAAELPGILLWTIVGWKRLREQGRLTQPGSGIGLAEQILNLSSPISEFVADHCVVAADARVDVATLFGAWCAWCVGKNKKAGSEQTFGRDLRAAVPTVDIKRRDGDTNHGEKSRLRFYQGLTLRSSPF